MPHRIRKLANFAVAALLATWPLVVAHGHDDEMKTGIGASEVARPIISSISTLSPQSYFQYGERSRLLSGHIILMSIAWILVLPIGKLFPTGLKLKSVSNLIGVCLSISRSRYSLLTQFIFLGVNTVGIVLIMIYNSSTPDLYPNNAHHKFGWWLIWIVSAQFFMGVISAYTGGRNIQSSKANEYTPVSTEAIVEHQRIHDIGIADIYRLSNDSGQGTEPNTESLRSPSISSASNNIPLNTWEQSEEETGVEEKHGIYGTRVDYFPVKRTPGLVSSRVLLTLQFLYDTLDRLILILGFVAITTGIVTYGGLFVGFIPPDNYVYLTY